MSLDGPLAEAGARRSERVLRGLVAVGPLAVALPVYGLLLDHLPERWFAARPLLYVFAAVTALCAGLGSRLAGQWAAARYLTPRSPAPAGPAASPAGTASPGRTPSAHTIRARAARHLLSDFREARHGRATVCGWSQYLGDEAPPTAIGTSYGLRLVMDLDLRDPRVNRRQIVESLVALQRPSGGWAASTQRGLGRPEVTAWVLVPAVRAGLAPGTEETLRALLEKLTAADDPQGMERTSVVASLVAAFAEIAPGSPWLPELSRRLLDAAHEDDGMVSWGQALHGNVRRSAPHTARAVIALVRAERALGEKADFGPAVGGALRWLAREDLDLRPTDEQLRRPAPGGDVDALFIGHFTAAWVARALMSGRDSAECERALRAAVRAVLDDQRDGVWTWHDGRRPIWMTYQGCVVLREYALRNLPWPP
ncbi:hypothetical protein [Bailinhaonella thermotolerans]|uniref:Squalene cyclase C-terminal domain-containing protein n=1 Tax=Bailinhaonella thermotolerans TaxID=1070861 RepID=A0A3A4B368_9ACTN|nr:hypothetical protein [Bailinhaonella thermotolerans]RJL32489.1 hypothetical protein D5H75_13225 [Bailinhaonella thermotolerans]